MKKETKRNLKLKIIGNLQEMIEDIEDEHYSIPGIFKRIRDKVNKLEFLYKELGKSLP